MIDPNLPINKTAALVVNKASKLDSFFTNQKDRISSITPLPTTKFDGQDKYNLTGRKFGKFEVIGYSIIKNSKGHDRWVCRCKCGRYQLFSSKTVLKGCNEIACIECEKVERLRHREKWLKTGINIPTKRTYRND